MIEGFRLRIGTVELQEHCIGRSKFHSDRAAEYTRELPKVKESMEALQKHGIATAITQMHGKGGSFDIDPVEDMENKIQDHGNRSLVFEFFSKHLFPEDYNLKEEDLIRLEVLKR
jgi:hypothetical protein